MGKQKDKEERWKQDLRLKITGRGDRMGHEN